jgi:hypothetical protein
MRLGDLTMTLQPLIADPHDRPQVADLIGPWWMWPLGFDTT